MVGGVVEYMSDSWYGVTILRVSVGSRCSGVTVRLFVLVAFPY